MQDEDDSEEQMEAVAAGLPWTSVRTYADDIAGVDVCVVVPWANGGEVS